MPGLVKIGLTTKAPQTRARKLFTTGVPCEFEIEHYWKVPPDDLSRIESNIHDFLGQWRYNENREFFSMDTDFATDAVNQYINEHNIKILSDSGSSEDVNGVVLSFVVVGTLAAMMWIAS